MFKIMKDYSKGYRVSTILTPVFVLFEVILDVLIPTMMAYIVDVAGAVARGTYVFGKDPMWDGILSTYPNLASGTTLLWVLGAVCVAAALLALLFGALAGRTVAIAGSGFASNLRKGIFGKIQGYSFANIDKFSTAGLVTRCTTDVNNAQQCFMQLIRTVIRAPLMLVMATVFAYRMSPDISWIFFIAIPLLGAFMAFISVKTYPRFRKMLNKYDEMNGAVQENLVGIRVVKAYVREDHEQEKYDKKATEVRFAHLAAEKMMVLSSPIATLIMYATIVGVLAIGGSQVIEGGGLGSGSLTSLISYATQILMSVMMVCFVIIQMVLSRASIQRISEALNEESKITDGALDKKVGSGKIVFENVNFSYSDNKDNLTLENINLTIESGQTVGVIGGTGEGKSSLVQLIPRFYDCLEGAVYVDDTDVRDYSLKNLRDGVSMVLQKNVLFSGTIESNLKWGNPDATHEEVVEACKIAQAHDFVESFPDGYQTDLGQGGVNVSGGQKQRLCIARALLKKPKIMILDDSTSAVDTATDAKIREGLKQLDASMTVIIISQRVSSLENCDKIIVIDEGKIDAVGTHEQLLKDNKIYQEVYHSQQKGAIEQ
ncbi:MAG: ABC transporter ATP-binding protein/permease [Corallococcus sp.]|nr:ABC transporter ATP-binding protein/permease [Corallococcus sp.]